MSQLFVHISKICRGILEQSYQHTVFGSRQLRYCSLVYTNSEEVDRWISTQDDETRMRIVQIQNQIVKQSKYYDISTAAKINIAKYQHLLDATSNERKRFINFLFQEENSLERHRLEKQIRKINHQNIREETSKDPKDHIRYGLGHNSLFLRFGGQWMQKWNCQKMAAAIHSKEPEIIYDCSFHHTMTPVELKSSVKHLHCSLRANIRCAQPFVVHICNVTKGSPLEHILQQDIPYLHKLPVFIHEQDIMEIMSPERLVYLSPNSQHVLNEFNPLDCYVMGCIVERGEKLPLTLPKATELNIRTARLPMDKIFPCSKHKVLSLEQVTQILIMARQSNNWQQAIIHHLKDSDPEHNEEEVSEIFVEEPAVQM